MNIAAAILLIGACGSASRTMTVEPSIDRIVLRVILGAVNDYLLPVLWDRTAVAFGDRAGGLPTLQMPSLRIDGQPRTGVLAWGEAVYRVAGYAIDRRTNNGDAAGVGSVEYSYRLRVRGFDIWRTTRIEDGRVSLLTDVYGRIGPRGELHHVQLAIHAVENGRPAMEGSTSRGAKTGRQTGTRITGTATGYSTIGSRCGIVSRIASRVISRELDSQLLGRVQAGGIDLYRAGAIVEAMK